MEGGTLFNPGFLGASFLWWVGQIVDDSTWRDNMLPGKFQDKESISGWGRRYKVRIIGLHDQEEETIPSDQLPWAQIMYPVTGGGGQTNAGQTANLRQGMFVFGFFLDGQEQQVPVIMGVLGNNAQTSLNTNFKNFAATSGYAANKEPKQGSSQEKVPDEGLVTTKPKSKDQSQECASPPPGVTLNQFGLRPDLPLSKTQFADQQNAIAEAERRGLTGSERTNFIQQKVSEGINNRCSLANSPISSSQPGATKENVDAVHELSSADVKREDKYQEKIVILKPDNLVESAVKGIQTVLDTLTQKINKYLNAIQSYIDAVSNTISNIQNLIANAACEIAKYMKILFDKIMEYVLKLLNKTLTKVVSAMPSSMRHMFADMKEIITELILCLYNKITNNLCGLIQGILNKALDVSGAEKKIRDNLSKPSSKTDKKTTPNVPVCYAEDIIGQAISSSKNEIDEANNIVLNNINAFLEDIQNQIAGVSGSLSDITSLIGSISGGLTAALSFENFKLNIFGCELKPNVAVSDFYTFARGGAGQPDSQLPSSKSISDFADKPASVTASGEIPYAEPRRDQPDLLLS
jgi:uncharacterized protein YoxC